MTQKHTRHHEDPKKDEVVTPEEEQSMATMTRERVIKKRLREKQAETARKAKEVLEQSKSYSAGLDMVKGLDKKAREEAMASIGKELGENKDLSAEASAKVERELTPEQQEALMNTLKTRFANNMKLHEKLEWLNVEKALRANPESLWSLHQLESTGGEPDVIGEDETGFIFGDCSKESPEGRRNVVFDKEAEEWLKANSPDAVFNGNAEDRVKEWGVDFMDEEQYNSLQKQISMDKHTSWSWLKTPADIRKSGGALSGYRFEVGVSVDRDDVRLHNDNGGFRCVLRVPKV
jgi:hypothetical protein